MFEIRYQTSGQENCFGEISVEALLTSRKLINAVPFLSEDRSVLDGKEVLIAVR